MTSRYLRAKRKRLLWSIKARCDQEYLPYPVEVAELMWSEFKKRRPRGQAEEGQ